MPELAKRPSLAFFQRAAESLRTAFAAGRLPAAARVRARLPERRGLSLEDVLARGLSRAEAGEVVAREYGFECWDRLARRLAQARELKRIKPHPRFAEALAAFDAGDAGALSRILAQAPDLVHARTNLEPRHGYFAGATLLHHIAGNPHRDHPLPPNAVELARILLEAGADANAETMGRNGGTTMGLLLTGKQASDMGLSGPLIDLLLANGARLDLGDGALDSSLINHSPGSAEKLIELGAEPDVLAAAALGDMPLLRSFFDGEGRLLRRPRRKGVEMEARDAIGLAMLLAYVREQREAVEFLLAKDGNWDMIGVNNGTAMHRAAWEGDLPMVQRLVALGADISNRENPYVATPLSWAQHNKQQAVFDWFRANCRIDLHDAVGFNLLDHVQARLRKDPASVNTLRDHWDIPLSAPLHWAAWPSVEDVDGTQPHEPSERERLVGMLLDAGADPNILAGNGLTPLDIAVSGKATGIADLLRAHGARHADEL